jgi:hypothetical protein
MRFRKRYSRRRRSARRDASDNSAESEETFRRIVRLAYRIREHRWEGRFDHADAAVLHDLLLLYYPEYKDLVQQAAKAGMKKKGIIVFNIRNAISNHRHDLRFRRKYGHIDPAFRYPIMEEGGVLLGGAQIFHLAENFNVRWIDDAPIYAFGGSTWLRHGIIVFLSKKMKSPASSRSSGVDWNWERMAFARRRGKFL